MDRKKEEDDNWGRMEHARRVLSKTNIHDASTRRMARRLFYEAQEAWAKEHYPVVDDTWPSRRWRADGTEYIDLSGI